MENIKFLLFVLWNVVWPPKGIIYMEEQLLQWIYAFGKVWLEMYGYVFLIIGAIMYLMHMRVTHHVGHWISHFISDVLQLILNTLLAWVYLIYGAVNGRINNTHQPWHIEIHLHGFHFPHVAIATGRPTLHYILGRGLYRLFYRFVTWLANRLRLRISPRQISLIARALAIFVIVWGCWNIPYDLTH